MGSDDSVTRKGRFAVFPYQRISSVSSVTNMRPFAWEYFYKFDSKFEKELCRTARASDDLPPPQETEARLGAAVGSSIMMRCPIFFAMPPSASPSGIAAIVSITACSGT